jgi:predicted dehydrogenase
MADNIEGTLGWGIIGAGRIARSAIAPAIHYAGNSHLVAVASRDARRAAAIRLECHADASCGSYEALLAHPGVQAVYIGLPNGLHEEWIIKSAEAGKHVLCDKSLAFTRESALRCREACRRAGVLLMEGFMYRHHPQWIHVRDLLGAGAVGQIRTITAHLTGVLNNDVDHRWSAELGRGAMYDVTCYGINAARYLAGVEPRTVAAAGRLRAPHVDLASHVALAFPNDITASVHGALDVAASQGLVVQGTTGTLEMMRPFIPGYDPAPLRLWRDGRVEDITVGGANHFLHQIEHFANCALTGAPLGYPAEDGVENATVCEKAMRQIMEG